MRSSQPSCARLSAPPLCSIPSNMKTLIITLAVLTLSLATLSAKDGTFISVIIPDGGNAVTISLSAHQWIKITNFTQNPLDDAKETNSAGVAVLKGNGALWVSFASDP